jgi:hypothetical protein
MFSNILIMMGLKKDWPFFTVDEIQAHNTEASLWIVAGSDVYDVTEFLFSHPGGPKALMKRGGGQADCTRDLTFHSAKGRAEWAKYQIGVVDRTGHSRNVPANNRKDSSGSTAGNGGVAKTNRPAVVSENIHSSLTASATALSPKTATPLRPAECCCTKSPSARAASQPSAQHCAHCTCPDRPQLAIPFTSP